MRCKNFGFKIIVGVIGILLAEMPAAKARDGIVDEIKLGFLSADTGIGGTKVEHGLDINGEVLFTAPQWLVSADDPEWVKFLLAPRPDIGFTANVEGGTSFGYIGLNWTVDVAQNLLNDHDGVFFSVGLGGAVSNSSLTYSSDAKNNKDMGSRGLFHLYTELGYRVTEHVNLSVFYEHYSNAGLGTSNPGMNNLGMRLGYKF